MRRWREWIFIATRSTCICIGFQYSNVGRSHTGDALFLLLLHIRNDDELADGLFLTSFAIFPPLRPQIVKFRSKILHNSGLSIVRRKYMTFSRGLIPLKRNFPARGAISFDPLLNKSHGNSGRCDLGKTIRSIDRLLSIRIRQPRIHDVFTWSEYSWSKQIVLRSRERRF